MNVIYIYIYFYVYFYVKLCVYIKISTKVDKNNFDRRKGGIGVNYVKGFKRSRQFLCNYVELDLINFRLHPLNARRTLFQRIALRREAHREHLLHTLSLNLARPWPRTIDFDS